MSKGKERKIIAFFGRRNSGKSSLVNAVTNQSMSIVSDIAGTTTDPVTKTMELLPLGPVTIIDTPGIDDVGRLGALRIKRTEEILRKTDIAVLVMDLVRGVENEEKQLVKALKEQELPFVIVFNKSDCIKTSDEATSRERVETYMRAQMQALEVEARYIFVSALTGENVEALKNILSELDTDKEKLIVADILKPKDLVVLVLPIDESAPRGRLILPQQQVLRELLDHHCRILCTQVEELTQHLGSQREKPALVITDSQAFRVVDQQVPKDVPLTSFSILFARYKGNLKRLVNGAKTLSSLKEGDKILIAEGCTHHRQCNDIGSVKIPNWIQSYCRKRFSFAFSSGNEFRDDLEEYALIVHCGGCMLNEKEMEFRMQHAKSKNKEMVNFGIAIAQMHGILKRAIAPFKTELE